MKNNLIDMTIENEITNKNYSQINHMLIKIYNANFILIKIKFMVS